MKMPYRYTLDFVNLNNGEWCSIIMSKDIKKLIAYFNYLGMKFNINSSEERFQIQKIAFIFKTMGMELNYNFHLWKHGPYSSSLAKDYYNINNDNHNFINSDYIIPEREKIILDKFINIFDTNIIQMESASTIMLLNLTYEDVELVEKKMKEIKPHLSDMDIINGQNKAKELLFKDEFLTDKLKSEMMELDNID